MNGGFEALKARIDGRTARVGVIGLGYVGLPLSLAFHRAGFPVLGFDIDPEKVEKLKAGRSYIRSVAGERVAEMGASGRFEATSEISRAGEADVLAICVPTPLDPHREPDLSFVEATTRAIAPHLREGQLVVLESTTYPGTTEEVVRPLLEAHGRRVGEDIFLAYSPEREDPGNERFETRTIPKVVAADDGLSLALAESLYGAAVERIVRVSNTRTAEAVKITENIYRAVNIALVNELKLIYDAMGIDVWEVIEAAKTKPFGFQAFYPGPGLGGHCTPIDPFYLTWKAREFGHDTRFIALAGEINRAMPRHVVARTVEALSDFCGKPVRGARLLVVGVAYKKNVDDLRESPALEILELLEAKGAEVSYHDPHVPVIPRTRDHAGLAGRASVPVGEEAFDAAIICTDHDAVDYMALGRAVPLIVDTRNAMARRETAARVVKA